MVDYFMLTQFLLQEAFVKRISTPTWCLIFLVVLALLLVACERPLQEEPELVTAPAVQTEIPSLQTPLAPLPTPEGLVTPGEAGPTPIGGEEQAPTAEQPGAATATPPAATEEPIEEDIIHTVAAGDTLAGLAQQYGVTIEAIAAANDLVDINNLDVGQQLLIPLGGDETTEPTPGAGEETTPDVHVVQAGDTLYSIGLRYGFTVEELAAYNELANPNRLEIGQRIRIPPEGYTVP